MSKNIGVSPSQVQFYLQCFGYLVLSIANSHWVYD